MGYIYLLREREFIRLSQEIYKIGMTNQENFERFKQYPKGSELILQIRCKDCVYVEGLLIKKFKELFIQCTDIGREYFEGDKEFMLKLIFEYYNKVNFERSPFYCGSKSEVKLKLNIKWFISSHFPNCEEDIVFGGKKILVKAKLIRDKVYIYSINKDIFNFEGIELEKLSKKISVGGSFIDNFRAHEHRSRGKNIISKVVSKDIFKIDILSDFDSNYLNYLLKEEIIDSIKGYNILSERFINKINGYKYQFRLGDFEINLLNQNLYRFNIENFSDIRYDRSGVYLSLITGLFTQNCLINGNIYCNTIREFYPQELDKPSGIFLKNLFTINQVEDRFYVQLSDHKFVMTCAENGDHIFDIMQKFTPWNIIYNDNGDYYLVDKIDKCINSNNYISLAELEGFKRKSILNNDRSPFEVRSGIYLSTFNKSIKDLKLINCLNEDKDTIFKIIDLIYK